MNLTQKTIPAFSVELASFASGAMNVQKIPITTISEGINLVKEFAKLCITNNAQFQMSTVYATNQSICLIDKTGKVLFLNKIINGKVVSTKSLFKI